MSFKRAESIWDFRFWILDCGFGKSKRQRAKGALGPSGIGKGPS